MYDEAPATPLVRAGIMYNINKIHQAVLLLGQVLLEKTASVENKTRVLKLNSRLTGFNLSSSSF